MGPGSARRNQRRGGGSGRWRRRDPRHGHARDAAQLDRVQARRRCRRRRPRQRRDRRDPRQFGRRHARTHRRRLGRPLQGQRQRTVGARPWSDLELFDLQRPRSVDRGARPLGRLPAIPVRAGQRRPRLQDAARRLSRRRRRRGDRASLDEAARLWQAAHPARGARRLPAAGRRCLSARRAWLPRQYFLHRPI